MYVIDPAAMRVDATPPARRPRGDETRRAILEAAMDLYGQRGFRGTGLAAIGQVAGITHAGVLYHFGSVQQLLQAVIDERDRRFWRETADTWEGRTGLEALRRMSKLAEWNTQNRGLAKLFATLEAESIDPEHEAHAFFVERQRRVRRRIRRAIEVGQRRGEIRADVDARLKADEVVSFMTGAQLTALLDPLVDLVAVFESYTDALVRSLQRDAAAPAKPGAPSRLRRPRTGGRS
jgi:AcrR family transcriptional regulator